MFHVVKKKEKPRKQICSLLIYQHSYKPTIQDRSDVLIMAKKCKNSKAVPPYRDVVKASALSSWLAKLFG